MLSKVNKKQGKKKSIQKIHRFPPNLNLYELSWSTVFRFEAQSNIVSLSVSNQNILDTYLVAITAIAGLEAFNVFRIRKVELWVPSGATIGSTNQGSCRFIGSIGTTQAGSDRTHSTSSMGADVPGHVVCKPQSHEAAAFWNNYTGVINNMFVLNLPSGGVLDLHVTFRNVAGITGTACAQALVGAVSGTTYFRGLDGLNKATTQLPQVTGVNTI